MTALPELKRYEVEDHTSGGYCHPHIAKDCEKCRQQNWPGEYYLASDVDALLAELGRDAERLREFATHKGWCDIHRSFLVDADGNALPCSCGFDAAMKANT